MNLLNRRDFEKLALASLAASVSGCDFYKTDSIITNTEDIFKTRNEFVKRIVDNRQGFVDRVDEEKIKLIKGYQEESGIISPEHPGRKKQSRGRVNEDGTCTIAYEVEFADIASIKTAVDEQLNGLLKKEEKKAVVSSLDNNRLLITLKERTDLSKLEAILGDADCYPPQILLKFSAVADFGDMAQDYASQLKMELRTNRGDFGAITDDTILKGALERLRTRADMGAAWGAQLDTSMFDVRAVLNVLESWGYSKNVFETYLLLSNNKEGSLSGEEKLPIPEQILAGVTPVVTQKMESIKSDFKGTAEVRDYLVYLKFIAGVGNAKRPDIRRADFLVPARDEVSSQGIYLPIGIPYIIGGKIIEMEIGVTRRDPFLRWLSQSKDSEKRSARVQYEVTPYRVCNWDRSKLGKPKIVYETLKPITIS